MITNLYINYYDDPNRDRQKELDWCVIKNSYQFDWMFIMADDVGKALFNRLEGRADTCNYVFLETPNRPTFNDIFQSINSYSTNEANLNIVANTDIVVPKVTLDLARKYITPNKCYALTRYDISDINDFEHNSTFFNRKDSQDTWIFQGRIKNINADFTLGTAGCDNSLAYKLKEAGYEVMNSSKSLKTYHLHLSNVRNYLVNKKPTKVIPPPYLHLPPI